MIRSLNEAAYRDIQGYILRGYRLPFARHFIITLNSSDSGKKLLEDLLVGWRGLKITSGESVPSFDEALNVGITYAGLRALGLPAASLRSFQRGAQAFARGADSRLTARIVGDTGRSSPDRWDEQFLQPDGHLLLSLYTREKVKRNARTRTLNALLARHGIKAPKRPLDAHQPVGDNKEHFGFRDGISQPLVDGFPHTKAHQKAGANDPQVPTGAFLLGYPNEWGPQSYPLPDPEILGFNGSFAAFRVLSQNVGRFQRFVTANATQRTPPEKLAAKLCGRWYSGAPLTHYPDKDPGENQWDDTRPLDYSKDESGFGCPMDAHARRVNPRLGGAVRHRIIRRGMKYGPPFEDDPKADRGLIGLFIGASLEHQFEFLMSQWINDSQTNSKDPLVGCNDTYSHNPFRIPSNNGRPWMLNSFPRFVTTRGALYCFLPSLPALNFLATQGRRPSTARSVRRAPTSEAARSMRSASKKKARRSSLRR